MKMIPAWVFLVVPGLVCSTTWADDLWPHTLHPDALYRRSTAPRLAQLILSRSTGRPYHSPQIDTSPKLQLKPEAILSPEPKAVLPAKSKASTVSRTSPGLDPHILARIRKFDPIVRHYSRLNALDPNLTRAVIYVESAGDPQVVSHKGATGLMQLMPATANDMGVQNLRDPAQNVFGGTRYLSRMLERFGSLDLALWAYNAGPESVKRKRLPLETRRYIPSVIRVKRLLDGGGV